MAGVVRAGGIEDGEALWRRAVGRAVSADDSKGDPVWRVRAACLFAGGDENDADAVEHGREPDRDRTEGLGMATVSPVPAAARGVGGGGSGGNKGRTEV